MDRCNELCTKETTGSCALCEALAERDRFERLWFKGGLFMDGAHALQRRGVFTFLHRYAFPLCFLVLGGLLHLWFAWRATGPYFVYGNSVFIWVLVISPGIPLLWWWLWWLPQRQVMAVPEEKDRIDLETKARQTMAQILGGAALLAGLFFTAQTQRISQEGLQVNQETLRVNQETLRTTQEGQITERFTKAIDQLGKPGQDYLAVRLGGIYALERIARESAKDYGSIMEVLTAFVREHSPREKEQAPQQVEIQARPVPGQTPILPPGNPTDLYLPGERLPSRKLSTEIETILTVLVRRRWTFRQGENQRLNLSQTDLREADLQEGNFKGIDLRGADLREARLLGADLSEGWLDGAWLGKAIFVSTHLTGAMLNNTNCIATDFSGAALSDAQLYKADLRKANLSGTTLIHTNLTRADLRGAFLWGAVLTDAQLTKADLRGVSLEQTLYLTQDQINEACVDERTALPEGLTRPAPCPANP